MRNQYISDYIYRTTGKRRSAKQVGSRLQQLRDTFHGKRRKLAVNRFMSVTFLTYFVCPAVLNSLAQNYKWGRSRSTQKSSSSSDSSCDGSSSESPIPSPSSSSSAMSQPYPTSFDNVSSRCTVVCIDLLPRDSSSPCGACDTNQPAEGIFSSDGPTDIFRPSYHPRPICIIDPTVTFVSRSVISAQSSCLVLLDGATIHKEVTPLALAGSSSEPRSEDNFPLMYGVKLVPNYWESLCRSPGKLLISTMSEYHAESNIDIQIPHDTRLFKRSGVYHITRRQA
jgi:transcriptional enhancer factor